MRYDPPLTDGRPELSEGAKKKADAQFKKLQRVADGKRAMSDYESDQASGYAKTAKLKAARLEREAREAAEKAAAPPAPAKAPGRKPPRAEGGD
jgi:hypothetical protein